MAFFFDIDKIRPLREVEVNGEDQQGDDQPTDYAEDDAGAAPPEDQTTQEDQPQEDQQDQPQDNPPDEGGEEPETTDYTEEDAAAGGDDGENPPPDDGGSGGSAPSSQEDQPVDDLKQKEEELHGDLTPEQLDIKHKELKNQFLAMYDLITNLSERINDACVSEENIEVVEYVSEQIADLKKMVVDYVNGVYKTKSYIENSINYNRFLTVINALNKILEEMAKNEE